MKKRIVKLLMVGLLSCMLVGCGNQQDTNNTEELTTMEYTITPTEEPTIEETTTVSTEEEFTEPTKEIETETETDAILSSETKLKTTEEPIPEPQAVYTYTDMCATMYATQMVNVRNLPSTDGEKIGSLSTNQEIAVKGYCNETEWFMFDYEGQTAFVSNTYVSTEKVEVPPCAQEATQVANVPRAGEYQEGVWHNMGDYSFYLGDWTWPNGCEGGGFHLNDGSARFCWLNYSDAQNSALNAFIRANQCNCGEVTHGGIKPLWDEATKSYYFP